MLQPPPDQSAELDRVPPLRQIKCLLHDPSRRVAPPQINAQFFLRRDSPQAEMQVRALFSRMTAATIHLPHEPQPIGQVDRRACAYRGPSFFDRRLTTLLLDGHSDHLTRQRENELQAQK